MAPYTAAAMAEILLAHYWMIPSYYPFSASEPPVSVLIWTLRFKKEIVWADSSRRGGVVTMVTTHGNCVILS